MRTGCLQLAKEEDTATGSRASYREGPEGWHSGDRAKRGTLGQDQVEGDRSWVGETEGKEQQAESPEVSGGAFRLDQISREYHKWGREWPDC